MWQKTENVSKQSTQHSIEIFVGVSAKYRFLIIQRNCKMAEHKKPRLSAEQWGPLIDAYRQSLIKADEFCSTRDLALGTFRKWRYQDRTARP